MVTTELAPTSTRQRLQQMPVDAVHQYWSELEDSESEDHYGCGWIPTGRVCHSCGKALGDSLPAPYVYQEDIINDDHLTIFASGGEQAGKSESTAMKFVLSILAFLGEYQEKAAGEVAWIVADSYELTRVEYDNTATWLKPIPFKVRTSKRIDPGEITISLPGGGVFAIKTRSANDANTLRAESPVVTLVGEASLLSFDAYLRLTSRVARSRKKFPGYGAVIMGSTFEGSLGWLPTLWSKWQSTAVQEGGNVRSMALPSGSNIFVYKGGMEDEILLKLKDELPDAAYKERVLAIPSPPSGRVHQGFDPTIHVQATEYDPEQPILIGMDPGYSGRSSTYAVETVQKRFTLTNTGDPCPNQHFWTIPQGEIFEREHVAEQIVGIAQARYWWSNPMKTAVIDIAGKAHAGAMESNTELWLRKSGLILMNQKVNIRPGIDRLEALFMVCPLCHEPYLVFDPSAKGVISELGGGVNPFDSQVHVYSWQHDREGNVSSSVPRDEYCDGIKALTYLFVNQFGYAGRSPGRRVIRVKRRGKRAKVR